MGWKYAWLTRHCPVPNGNTKNVLVHICMHIGKSDTTWVSQDTLSAECCISRQAVCRAVAWLRSNKVLLILGRHGRSLKYGLDPAWVSEMTRNKEAGRRPADDIGWRWWDKPDVVKRDIRCNVSASDVTHRTSDVAKRDSSCRETRHIVESSGKVVERIVGSKNSNGLGGADSDDPDIDEPNGYPEDGDPF